MSNVHGFGNAPQNPNRNNNNHNNGRPVEDGNTGFFDAMH